MSYPQPQLLTRRHFLQVSAAFTAGAACGCGPSLEQVADYSELEQFIASVLAESRAPGLTAALVKGDELLWSKGFGFADKAIEAPMTPETIQNIGSISKTVTATAVMQLWEQGAFQLDDDVNGYLPYSVRNPRFPEKPITIRQLLTHRSSITDGPAYGASYACGDPAVSLADWIEGYFSPDGAYYNEDENFLAWEPGTVDPPTPPRAYSNVAYGLLGVLVERIAEVPFNEYCGDHIFKPLGMSNTGWHLAEVNTENHAVPYSYLPEDFERDPDELLASMLPQAGITEDMIAPGQYLPHCLYSFYNYPDGLLRTNVNDFSRYLRAYMNGGMFEGYQLLKAETIGLMLSDAHFERGLCWDTYELVEKGPFWGHDGGDPGVATFMGFDKSENIGLVLFFNYDSFPDKMGDFIRRVLEAARA